MAPDIRLQNGRLLASIKNSAPLELRRCDTRFKMAGLKMVGFIQNGGIILFGLWRVHFSGNEG